MAELYNAIVIPFLCGLLIISVIINALVMWQMERTWRIFSITILFVSLTLLYLVVALRLPTLWRDIGRIGLMFGLLGSNFFRGRDLIIFLRKKGETLNVEGERKSLVTIATEKEDVVLSGFTSPITEPVKAKEATDVHQ